MPRKKTRARRKKSSASKRTPGQIFLALFWRTSIVLVVIFAAYLTYLDVTILTKFEGKKWAIP